MDSGLNSLLFMSASRPHKLFLVHHLVWTERKLFICLRRIQSTDTGKAEDDLDLQPCWVGWATGLLLLFLGFFLALQGVKRPLNTRSWEGIPMSALEASWMPQGIVLRSFAELPRMNYGQSIWHWEITGSLSHWLTSEGPPSQHCIVCISVSSSVKNEDLVLSQSFYPNLNASHIRWIAPLNLQGQGLKNKVNKANFCHLPLLE